MCMSIAALFTLTVRAQSTVFCENNTITHSCIPSTCTSTPASVAKPASSSGGGGGCGSSNSNENKMQIWSFLKSKGLTDDAAAGILGNFEQESTFNPKALNSIGCLGIAQWCNRRTNLESFAAERGQPADCLGIQLEFMWYEMTETNEGRMTSNGDELEIPLVDALNGTPFSRSSEYSGSAANIAAQVFHDYYERANMASGEHKGRGERADRIFQELTGRPSDTSLLNANGRSSNGSSRACPGGAATNGAIPSEECQALLAEYKALVDAGKITYYGEGNREFVNKDLENCTTDQIECGTGGGKGGVHPRILRATVAAAKNSGATKLEQWNFNSGHSCDGKNHPRGMAIDIYCEGNRGTAKGGVVNTASADCNALFKYFYDHYDELGLTELIWQYPPTEYSCGDPKIMCDIPGHADHIHVGTRV